MIDKRGIISNRTSFNEKQEVQARSIGVLNKNTEIRNTVLKKNIGKYAMWGEQLSPAIGEVYDVYGSENNPRYYLDENGLLGYTTTGTLGEYLNQHYKRDARELEIYDIINPNPSTLAKWGGKYENYVKYISHVYGHEVNFYTKINDILSMYDIKYVLDKNRVGVVRNPDPLNSVLGINVTNINNFSGHDTQLGEITNYLYAQTLLNAAYFNSLRKNQTITDSLKWEYGMNSNTMARLDTLMGEFDENGRIPFLAGQLENNIFEHPYYGHTPNTDYGTDFYNELSEFNKKQLEKYQNINAKYDLYGREGDLNGNWELYGFNKRGYSVNNPYIYGLELFTERILIEDVDEKGNPTLKWEDHHMSTMRNNDYKFYSENDLNNDGLMLPLESIQESVNEKTYTNSIPVDPNDSNTLLSKTHMMFSRRKINTLIGRFASGDDGSNTSPSLTQTAISKYGISHGRNLLKVTPTTVHGYTNPYCRVWTYHHQYDRINRLIRPFTEENGDTVSTIGIADLQKNWTTYSRHKDGAVRLAEHTVLNPNGFVNITPTAGDTGIDIKKTMFSIENLAWKDVNKNLNVSDLDKNLSKKQIGPLGGRIMWFPPYNIKFTENVNVDWNSNQFIGRGEKVYTYTDTERSGTLSFSILIDHPSVLNYWRKGKAEASEEDEQSLLRFFAGCDTLDLVVRESLVNTETGTKEPTDEPMTPNEITPDDGKIVFYVFYPNNYSGIDDYPVKDTQDNRVDAMTYLFCGEGVQEKKPLMYPDMQNFSGPGYEMTLNTGISNGEKIDNKWEYRVDNAWRKQKLRRNSNYKDSASFQLNSKFNDTLLTGSTHSFAEVYAALNNKEDIKAFAVKNGADVIRIIKLTDLFQREDFSITQVDFIGSASSHGYEDINEDKLSNDRATAIKSWLESMKLFKDKVSDNTKWSRDNDVGEVTSNDANSLEAKLARSARIEIGYRINKVSNLDELNALATLEEDTGITPPANTIIVKDDYLLSLSNNSEKNKNNVKNNIFNTQFDYKKNAYDGLAKELGIKRAKQTNPLSNIRNENERERQAAMVTENQVVENPDYQRYDDESEFFKLLDVTSPTIRSKIVSKIQYFDPAFHSITPEGFNARLNFLHQCTRQGHTISVADGSGYARTAGNLSFGRPPVCVLRIGDFYNTRIIIQSMTIDYDAQQWDLNPEGIGVQPMIANVNLNFVFLGGSDLGGPIERLQNAITFNYYANTNVYDNRADSVTYKDDGTPEYKQWLPKSSTNVENEANKK